MEYFDTDNNDLSCKVAQQDDSFCKNDGWWVAFLLMCIVFGPHTAPGSALPPMRLSDFVIFFMLIIRWWKTYTFYGGVIFSPRIRLFSVFMFILAGTLTFSTILGTIGGRYPFYIKNFFIPLVFIQGAVIAAITATFTFGPNQAMQLAKGLLFMSVIASVFSFVQRFAPYLLSGLVERFYAIEYESLNIATEGTGSRVVGTFGNPNVWGACLVMLGSISIPAFIYLKGATIKLAALAAYLISGLAILFTTGSRTSVIALMVVSMFAIMFSLRGKAIIWIIIAVPFIFSFFFWIRANVDSIPINPRMKNFIRGEQTIEEGVSTRFGYWQGSLDAAKGSYIFGVGGTRFVRQQQQLADNGYIMMLLRTGLVGLGIYLLMLIRLSYRGSMTFLREKESHIRCLILISLMVLVCHILFE
ncbi:MAG: O-antigen ligase family protein, partial [Phycisphaerae bacterium]